MLDIGRSTIGLNTSLRWLARANDMEYAPTWRNPITKQLSAEVSPPPE
jgi:hypothetical protein